MKLGAEPRKVVILAVLLLVAAVSAWLNFSGDATSPPEHSQPAVRPNSQKPANAANTGPAGTSTSTASTASTAASAPRGGLVRASRSAGADQRLGDFRPVFKSERRGESLDPTKVNPALRTDLLAKLQEVQITGPARNLFQFGQAPPPPRPPEPKIIPKPVAAAGPLDQDGNPIPATPVKAPPPPIPLRYYGFVDPRQPGDKRAFFMEGEEIRIAAEGELIKQRYRVMQIGPKSALVEDTQFDNQQTLAIQQESGT